MRDKLSNVLWGLFFIAIGVGVAGNVLEAWNFELFFDGWWTFFIIIPCFIGMIQSGFGFGSTMGFIIGVLLFISCREEFNLDVWKLIVPTILIFTGLRIMIPGVFRKGHSHFEKTIFTEEQTKHTYSSGNKTEHSAIFSSNRIHVQGETFTGTNLNAVFGGIVLDLRDAVIASDVEITATAIFGGIDIFIPRGVRVKANNVPIFGGISNKTEQFADPNAPTIYLNSTCMFGGIDIK